jgi:hypothetical protein
MSLKQNETPETAPAHAALAQSENPEPASADTRRAAANRANARRSTGPRTPEGKARSSQNALKLGLFARSLGRAAAPLLGEEYAEFEALLADLQDRYAPEGAEEEWMVDRMASLWWRLARLTTHAQAYLRRRLGEGAIPLFILKEVESIGPEEARLERALQRLRKDLAFLQRYRQDAAREAREDEIQRADEHYAEFVAQYNAETERQIADARRRERARRGEEPQAEELPIEGVDAAEAGTPVEDDSILAAYPLLAGLPLLPGAREREERPPLPKHPPGRSVA